MIKLVIDGTEYVLHSTTQVRINGKSFVNDNPLSNNKGLQPVDYLGDDVPRVVVRGYVFEEGQTIYTPTGENTFTMSDFWEIVSKRDKKMKLYTDYITRSNPFNNQDYLPVVLKSWQITRTPKYVVSQKYGIALEYVLEFAVVKE